MTADPTRTRPTPTAEPRGMALVMVLIFTVLLYAMISELVITAQTARLTGQNDVLLTRMRGHMDFVLAQVEEMLLDDLASASEGGGEGGLAGALGGAGGGEGLPGGGSMPGAGGGEGMPGAGEGEEEEEDPAAVADGSQDAWYEPTAYADNDITAYVWVEDENRKFNILALLSPDEEFARDSRERFVRLIDALREGTDFDLTRADGEMLAEHVVTWLEGRTRTEFLPRPPLKSDVEDRPNITLPLELDELLLLPLVEDEVFYDRVLDGRPIPGLESILTVYTSLTFDPGDPNDPANQRREAEAAANGEGAAAGGEGGTEGAGRQPGSSAVPGGGSNPTAGGGVGEEEAPQPQGLGIRININTATRPVLRCLFPPSEIPDSVIDAILRWRNEPVEEDPFATGTGLPDDYLGDVDLGQQEKRQMFTEVAQLEEIPEFQNLPDPAVKEEFLSLLTTKSDVFTIHMATLHQRNEETRTYVLQRERSVVVRLDEGEEGHLHPILLHEERRGLRVMPVDFPEDDLLFRSTEFSEMDAFTQEERAWNPFYVDFYRPRDEREQLFDYRERLR